MDWSNSDAYTLTRNRRAGECYPKPGGSGQWFRLSCTDEKPDTRGGYRPQPWVPSATVEKHYKMGMQDDAFTIDGMQDSAIRAAVNAVVGCLFFLGIFFAFRVIHGCRLCKCCPCFQLSLPDKYRTPAKYGVALCCVIVPALMFGSLGGAASFSDAIKTVDGSLDKTLQVFKDLDKHATSLNTHATTLAQASGQLANDYASCKKFFCSGNTCPSSGAFAGCGRENGGANQVCDVATCQPYQDADTKTKVDRLCRTASEAITPQFDMLRDSSSSLAGMMAGPIDSLEKMRNMDAVDGVIKTGVLATVLFACVVAGSALLSTLCLSDRSRKICCCQVSTLFQCTTDILGMIFLIVLVVLITAEMVSAVVISDICIRNPETAMLDQMQDAAGASGGMDILRYYFTCEGDNPLDPMFELVQAGLKGAEVMVNGLETRTGCATAAIASGFGGTSATFDALQATISCKRINEIVLDITRGAMCTHAVDGLNTLWTVQAATGVFLIIALVLFKLVQATFKKHRAGAGKANVHPITDAAGMQMTTMATPGAAGFVVAADPNQPQAMAVQATPVVMAQAQPVADPNLQFPAVVKAEAAAPEPAAEPAPEPAAEPAPEPVAEPAAAPADEAM